MIQMYNLQKYKNLIISLLNAGLKPTINWKGKLNSNSLLLRHDIDFSIEYAYELAKAEYSLKIQSTFFFMLSSDMYNLISTHNQKLVNEIINMNHKVSIHYDLNSYKNFDNFIYKKKLFENIFHSKVDIVSIHRPGNFLFNNNSKIAGIPHTYQDVYFKQIEYISDSGGRDVFPSIHKYLNSPRRTGLQLLIHPIWWVTDKKSVKVILNSWRAKHLSFLTSEIKNNCKTYHD